MPATGKTSGFREKHQFFEFEKQFETQFLMDIFNHFLIFTKLSPKTIEFIDMLVVENDKGFLAAFSKRNQIFSK